MSVVGLIFVGITAGDFAWWVWADSRLRKLWQPSPLRSLIRALLFLFVFSQLFYLGTVLLGPRWHKEWNRWLTIPFVAEVYLWSLLVLPVTLLAFGLRYLLALPVRVLARRPEPVAADSAASLSRRRLLTSTAIALPPLAATLAMGRALPQLSHFRLNSMSLRLPALPPALAGLRIAQLTDLHVGRYTKPPLLPRIVESINALDVDLILFTGDLIDYSLDDLPRGIRTLQQLRSKLGLYMIEGNHDLFQDPDEFDTRVKDAGLKLLLNDAATIEARGFKLQLLGTRWGVSSGDRRKAPPSALANSVHEVARLRDPDAFPILMAHHPHSFDAAVEEKFPLVLSGHTHGGQLMLTPKIGFGPLFYRYWSGRYQIGDSQLIVSNGVGNWFPLRVNAPAEINLVTLTN